MANLAAYAFYVADEIEWMEIPLFLQEALDPIFCPHSINANN